METVWLRQHREKELKRVLAMPGLSEEQKETVRKLDRLWVLRDQRLATRASKVRWCTQFGRFLGKPFDLATREDLERFLCDIAGRCKPATVKQWKVFLKSFYKDLLAPDRKLHPKLVRWIRIPRRYVITKAPQDMLTEDEVKRLVASCTHPRDKALIIVLAESGARLSELVSTRIRDVTFDRLGAHITLGDTTDERAVLLVHSVADLQRTLGLPVLATVPRIELAAERVRRLRLLRRLVGAGADV